MKLDRAIEVNQEHAKEHDLNVDQGYFRALNLGINALKQVQKFQSMGSKIHPLRLTGETEE